MRIQRELIEFVEQVDDEKFVLVELIDTEGSTYRKKGAMKVVSLDGSSSGLISGGCLEKHIVKHALEFSLGAATNTMVIDTSDEYDRLFGSNIGCQGKLTLEFDLVDKNRILSVDCLGIPADSELSVHVFGAGVDIDPLRELFDWSRWKVAYYTALQDIFEDRIAAGWPIQKMPELPGDFEFPNPSRSAVLLMSHNYPYDLDVLSKIVNKNVAYIGILGPEKRKLEMIKDLKKIYGIELSDEQKQVLHGPVGMSNLGRGGPAIALAIVSELQSKFFSDRECH